MATVPTAPPIRGVVFDFHHTLAHGGDPAAWLRTGWQSLGRDGNPREVLGAQTFDAAAAFLDRLWEHARDVDPESRRDLDPAAHRAVFDRLIEDGPGLDPPLADALYAAMPVQWDVYDDAVPVLQALREKGIRTAMLSNVGFDLTPTLERTGIGALLDGTVMSYALGSVKPDPAIFQRALDLLGLPASEVLMVGDAWRDDGGAAGLGMRTLILPRTDDPSHGLELVLRLV